MQIELVKQFLAILNYHTDTTESAEWLNIQCPFAPWKHQSGQDSRPSFGINVTQEEYCNCFTCGYTGDLEDLVTELHALNSKDKRYDLNVNGAFDFLDAHSSDLPFPDEDEDSVISVKIDVDYPFPDWYVGSFETAYSHPYLKSRFMPYEVAKKLDVRFDSYQERVCFPIKNAKGETCRLHGRHIGDGTPPYYVYKHEGEGNAHVWMGEDTVDFAKPLVIVESVFDLARVLEFYPNVISPLRAGVTVRNVKQRIEDAEEVILMLDGDEAGRKCNTTIRNALPDTVIHEVKLMENHDPSDYVVSDLQDLLHQFLT